MPAPCVVHAVRDWLGALGAIVRAEAYALPEVVEATTIFKATAKPGMIPFKPDLVLSPAGAHECRRTATTAQPILMHRSHLPLLPPQRRCSCACRSAEPRPPVGPAAQPNVQPLCAARVCVAWRRSRDRDGRRSALSRMHALHACTHWPRGATLCATRRRHEVPRRLGLRHVARSGRSGPFCGAALRCGVACPVTALLFRY